MTHAADFTILLDLFIKLVESQAGKRIEEGSSWLNNAQVLANKLFRHLVSMKILADGATTEIYGKSPIVFIDHGSVKVLARTALETYLVFFYLFGSTDRSLSHFRYMTWKLGGLFDRQKFHAITQYGKEVLAKEKIQIGKMRSEILAAPYFEEYTDKQRKKLLNGEWRIGKGWGDLGEQAGFHKKYFDNVYGYLCGYSHSSYLSVLQIGQADSIDEQQSFADMIIGIGVVLMAHFTFSYVQVFPIAETILSSNPQAVSVAKKWRFGSEDMEALYGR